MSYDNWKKRLAGEAVKTFLQPGNDDEGYYRKPVKQKLQNGQWKTLGWNAVALWVDGGELVGLIGSYDNPLKVRELTADELTSEEFWSYIVANPISYSVYKTRAEDGKPWPDEPAEQLAKTMENGTDIPAANREVAKTDNNPPEELPPEKVHEQAIDNAIGVSKVFDIKTEADAGQALGIKNRLAELRLAATRDGEALYKPPFAEYKRLYAIWNPMVARADTEEKALNTKILRFRESERKRIVAEQWAAAKKAADEAYAKAAAEANRLRAEQEENDRAADRAIARGEPEVPPVVVETEAPPVAPVVTAAPTPAPAPLTPTYGKRRLKEEEKTFLDEDKPIDWDLLFSYFKNTPEVQLVLKTLALAAVRAGREVPGVSTRKGLI